MILLLGWFALAAEPPSDPALVEPEADDLAAPTFSVATPVTLAPTVVAAAAALGTPADRLDATRAAIELLYQRRYKDARRALDAIAAKWPGSAVAPVGNAILYQALMFENYDFRYEAQYRVSAEAARAELDAAAAIPGDEAFEQFLGGGIAGLDAIMALRKGELLSALGRAIEGMRALDRTKALAPGFADTRLADGIYLYWRSVVTRSSSLLPDFPDKRAEGLAALAEAERSAALVGPAASLALVYAWIEDRSLEDALARSAMLRLRYPDNVINNLTMGRVYTSLRRYDDALRVFDDVRADDPQNQWVHYLRGVVLARVGRITDAKRAFSTYAAFPEAPAEPRAQALYRLGTLYLREGDTAHARSSFERAVALGKNEAARRALARMGD